MNDLVPINLEVKIPEKWDYGSSVNKTKNLVYKWKNLTKELFIELWIAREMLSKPGNPHREVNENNVPVKTWADYCCDIGVEKRTANRWIQRIVGSTTQQKQIKEKEYDETIKTTYVCPKCGYSWN